MSSLPPPPQPPTPSARPVWRRWWFWVGVVVVLAAIGSAVGNSDGDSSDEVIAELYCSQPAAAWLDTLHSAFYKKYRDEPITASANVEAETSEGRAYYVAVVIDGVSGAAVFGTSDPPLKSNPGLIAAANPAAVQLSDLGADIREGSPAGTLLLDDDGIAAAESCKLKSI